MLFYAVAFGLSAPAAFAGHYELQSRTYPAAVVTEGIPGFSGPGYGNALSGTGAFALHISGTVTDVYKPDTGYNSTTDPPPTKILVQLVMDVSYSSAGDSGTCSGSATTGMTGETGAENDQHDDGMRGLGYASGARHGEKWVVLAAGGEDLTIISPAFSASASGDVSNEPPTVWQAFARHLIPASPTFTSFFPALTRMVATRFWIITAFSVAWSAWALPRT